MKKMKHTQGTEKNQYFVNPRLSNGDYNYFIREIFDYFGDSVPLNEKFLIDIIYKAYYRYSMTFKDSHRLLLSYYLNTPKQKPLEVIAYEYRTTVDRLQNRWTQTVRKNFSRCIKGAIIYDKQPTLKEFTLEDMVNVCGLSKRAQDALIDAGVANYDELVYYVKNHRIKYLKRVGNTNFAERSFQDILSAEARLRNDFKYA